MFEDRKDAGDKLAEKLEDYKKENPIILALPRGGVVVGFEIAKALQAPLGVVVVRKIGAPNNPEFGIGAVAEGNVLVLDKPTISLLHISDDDLAKVIRDQKNEIERRIRLYQNKELSNIKDKTVIIVDDGLATGVTARAAIDSIRKLSPKQVIFAVPVCAYETMQGIKSLVDFMVCLVTPQKLQAIGEYYKQFAQITDQEVMNLLQKARQFVLPKPGF